MVKGWQPLSAALAMACAIVWSSGSREVRADDPAPQSAASAPAETKYLSFQLMTGLPGYSGPPPIPGRSSLGKAQLDAFVRNVGQAIGRTGDDHHKLCFAVGPLCFDMSDEETRQCIRDAFAVARENDVAVAFHIDDSMTWGRRKDLLSNPENIETAGWNEGPNNGRRADWGPKPTKFPPQMCFNSPGIIAAVKDRGRVIGEEIQKELADLKTQGKPHLFACVMTGWETQIGSDFETNRALGFRALRHRGFSASKPPKDIDRERVQVVKEFMELWANSLHDGGIPRERIFCHIAFTDQGLRKADAKESYAQKVHFAVPEVAFSSAYRPGFSTYPEGATFNDVYAVIAQHGASAWISAEGTNVSPTSMPGEPTMESYLARMFNHGAVMTNLFSWGMGGEAMRNNFFRKATENPEALAAYAKFLRGEPLRESASTGFSSQAFQAKMRRIQAELPAWVQKSGRQAQVTPLMHELHGLVEDRKWQEADKLADRLLALSKDEKPEVAQPEPSTLQDRLARKIHRIQKELPTWVQKTGKMKEASALMKELDEQLKGQDLEAAEKTADGILKMIGIAVAVADQDIPEDAFKRLRHELGGPFLVSRDKVQEELKLTEEQKKKIHEHIRVMLPDAMQWFQKTELMNPEERQKALGSYRQQANRQLSTMLKETITPAQDTRLHQLERQRDGLFGNGETWNDLKFTEDQRRRAMAEIQQTHEQIDRLLKQAHEAGNPQEIRPQVLKMRLGLQSRLEDLLSDAQRQQWREMLGKRLDPDSLLD